jgi:hypothetical protein
MRLLRAMVESLQTRSKALTYPVSTQVCATLTSQ